MPLQCSDAGVQPLRNLTYEHPCTRSSGGGSSGGSIDGSNGGSSNGSSSSSSNSSDSIGAEDTGPIMDESSVNT